MIKEYHLEDRAETYLRIWQKIMFGKEVLDLSLFENTEIKDTQYSYRFKIQQFDNNTRVVYLNGNLILVTSEESIYNYLDTGRVYTSMYSRYSYNIIYIYNDILITEQQIKDFEDYKDKDNMNLKKIGNMAGKEIVLVFNEDLDRIKQRLAELRAEREAIEKEEKQAEISNLQEKERVESLIKQYDKMILLEDKDIIIKDNYIIDKVKGLKIQFKDKVINIFEKEDLVSDNLDYQGNFIRIDYRKFLYILARVYNLGKWEKPIEEKLKTLHKKWLNFKIYSYNVETKEEKLLSEVKIENNVNDKGKLRFVVNGVKMPIQKMEKVMNFLGADYYHNSETIIERLKDLNNYLERIRIYSGTQLELLNGKDIEISISGIRIPIHFNITAEDKDHWEISIDNFKAKKDYTAVKESFRWLSGGGLSSIGKICNNFDDKKLEEVLINKIKVFVEKRRLAEEKAEGLFNEFLEKNKARVIKKDNGYIVKGKLKNYLVKMKNEEDVGVWSYPGNDYICIEEKTQAGKYLCKYDKLLQFCLTMLNDNNMRENIYTIR